MSKTFKKVAGIAAPIVGGALGGPAGAAIGSGIAGSLAGSEASGQLQQGASQAAAISARQADIGRADIRESLQPTLEELSAGSLGSRNVLAPIASTGLGAFNIQAALAGGAGAEAQKQAIAAFQADPGQQFLQREAEQASIRNATATGGLGGGRIQQELQRQAIGFSSQNLQNRLANLASIAQPGLAAASKIADINQDTTRAKAQAELGTGTALANIAIGQAAPQAQFAQQGAQAQAAGTLGQNSAIQQTAGQLANIAGGQTGRTPGINQQSGGLFGDFSGFGSLFGSPSIGQSSNASLGTGSFTLL